MQTDTGPVIGGTYVHYKKSQKYRVIDVVRHSETLEELVLYEALYKNELCRLWVRPMSIFMSEVAPDTPRFRYVSDELI